MKKYFIKLGKHKLRGMKTPLTLYGVKIDFGKEIKKLNSDR